MSRTGTIFQINVSRGGVPKLPIAAATVDRHGITVDAHADGRNHGGPDRALCLFSIERLIALRTEGHTVGPGVCGENITTVDLDWSQVVRGARIRLGEAVTVEITGYAPPCWKNARWFRDGDFSQIDEGLHPGRGRVYARVLAGGTIAQGDPITVLEEPAGERVTRMQPRTFRWPRDFQGS